MWTNYSCCVQCAVPNISKRIYNAKKKWQSTRHRTVWEVLIWDPTLEKCWSYRHLSSPRWICCVTSNHTVLISCHPYHLFSPLYDSCLLLFPPGLQFHQTGDWWTCSQWRVAAHPQWTCYPMQGSILTRWHPLAPVRLWWSHITLPGVCACMRSRVTLGLMTTAGHPPFKVWSGCGAARCLFIIQNENVAPPHGWLLMLLFIARICEIYLWSTVYVSHTGKHAPHLRFDFFVAGKRPSQIAGIAEHSEAW